MNENTKTARAEWESMSGEQQYNALVAMAWTVRRKAEARNQTGARGSRPRMTRRP